jgi:uncharacterized delta-60 repeat protein
MAQFRPLFLDTGSIEVATGSRVADFMHFPVTASSVSASYNTLLPDPYLFATMSADRTNASSATSTSLFEFNLANRQENYFYPHNSIVGVSTAATATGVRIGLQSNASTDRFAHIKVASTLTAHTIANIGTQSPTTFALPGSMVATTTIYPAFVKGLYNNSTATAALKNVVLLQSETNNTVTARVGSVSYNKFVGYNADFLDRTFNTGSGFDARVQTIAIQQDQKILVGGIFSLYNNIAQNNISRLFSNGSVDSSFNIGAGVLGSVASISIQSDGKIIAAGTIASYSGSAEANIVRINSDGTRDTSFNVGTGLSDSAIEVAVQSDEKVVVIGGFTSYNGTTQNRITRINSDGTRDASFNVGTGFDPVPFVLTIQQDQKILVGGLFTTYSGSVSPGIVRINSDGTKDTSFNPGTGFNSNVESIAVQSDQKILVGGAFTTYSGSTSPGIVRINSDGTKDTSFNPGTGFDISTFVNAIYIQNDGKIIAVGTFSSYSGSIQNGITRINSDGTRDTTFNTGTGFILNGVVPPTYIIAAQSNGNIILGGDFTSYNGKIQNNITRLLPEFNLNQTSIPLYLSTGSLTHITGGHTITSSFLPATSSQWLSQSLAANVANTSNTVYATVFSLTGLQDNKRYLANLYIIGQSAAAATGFRMRVQNGSNYRGTLYTPTSTTAAAIRNSEDGTNITSIAAGTWPTINTKYLVFGEYTFIKTAGTTPEVQILSETNNTAVTAFSGSVIFYTPIH